MSTLVQFTVAVNVEVVDGKAGGVSLDLLWNDGAPSVIIEGNRNWLHVEDDSNLLKDDDLALLDIAEASFTATVDALSDPDRPRSGIVTLVPSEVTA